MTGIMARSGRAAAQASGDAELIRRSLAEPEAFTALYDRHAPAIHRYVARRLGADAADDLMAETFLIAFRKRRRYDLARDDARPWLYGIVTRLVARHRKAETARYLLLERLGGETAADPVDSESRVTAQALRGPLARALADLPRVYREPLLLVAWADLSYEEVAAALDVPVGTVRSRLSRGRARLRTALGGADPTKEGTDG
ncbi:RNA polymerase sigma factor [Actinomadura fibrosa]|uniref:RNA polymerase sigma factor n=1 Tax=Actinomadura fibrosa TaxID=111802 RepID=A0ABW2XT83_9ACTN|nr:RNA polymerase sigma factor [Actinomadura fibrosa]